MEIQLKNWITEFRAKNDIFPTKTQIKFKALELTDFKGTFKASKGWFEKFIARQFPELIDRTKKRLRKRCFIVLNGKTGSVNRVKMHNQSVNTNTVNNSGTTKTVKKEGVNAHKEDHF